MIAKYFSKSLFQVIFHVTFRCNARCGFCFNWRDINQNAGAELTLDEIEKISKSMPKFPWLMLSGGEPMLRNDLSDIIQIFCRNNKTKHLTLPTNGLAPERTLRATEEILEKCKNLTVTLSFSIDSTGEEHDKMRGVEGCYKKMIESYNAVQPLRKNKRLNVKFHTVLTNSNYNKLNELIAEARKLKPDMHTIEFVRGDLKDKNIALPPKEERAKIIKTIKENYDYYSGYRNLALLRKASNILQKAYLDLFEEILEKETQAVPCLAHKLSIVIYPYGDASFCEPLPPFENFRKHNYSYKELTSSEGAEKQRETIKNKKCFCYHPCFQYLNILFNKKRIAKEALKNAF